MDTLSQILSIVAAFIAILTFAITQLARATKNAKLAKWARVADDINGLVQQAEGFINYNGADKKEWVLTKAQQYCINNKIAFDIKKADEIIEKAVTLSKNVNKKDVG